MTRYIQGFLLILLAFVSQYSQAQIYPVQVVPTVVSPYSSKLSDYSNPMDNRLNLQLITTDILMQKQPIELHIKIQGNGLTAQTAPILSGIRPIYLNGGEILSLSSIELAEYFRFQNLHGITTSQYSKPLPDGVYNICYQVLDAVTKKKLSQNSCATIYLMLNDPPILNLPSQNEQIASGDFTNIIFSWTPRQINATNVSYQYELKEILDPNLDPRFAFEVSPLLYKEEGLRSTTLLYDISKPTLIPNKRYAWRVKAISTSGLGENSVFKNDGYSEVYTFSYTTNCSAPRFLLSEQQSLSRVKVMWQGESSFVKYHLQYRKSNVENAEWFEAYTLNTHTILSDLEHGFTYDFRVGASCENTVYGVQQSYVYSDIQTFSISEKDKDGASKYNCGIVPKIEIENREPLPSMVINETFMAGDFPVKVLDVSGDNGWYSGRGYIQVPYLFDTRIEVAFNNVNINNNYQLIEGVVETTYDPDWSNVDFVDDLWDVNQQEIVVDFPIEKIEIVKGQNEDDIPEIKVIGENGNSLNYPGGKDTVITDSEGKSFYVDSNGTVSGPFEQADGGKSTPENTDGVDSKGGVTELTSEGIRVTFEIHKESKYSYDKVSYDKALTKDYKKVNGEYIPFKAVVNGSKELFVAKVDITDEEVKADSLIFKTKSGVKINAKRIDSSNDFVLELIGTQKFAIEEIQATIKQGDKYKIAGVFNLVHVSPRTIQLKLVPTSKNLKLDDKVSATIKAIYSQLGIDVQVEVEDVFDISTHLSEDKSSTKDEYGFLSNYSKSQLAIIADFKKKRTVKEAYYLFVTDAKSSTGQSGYMGLNNQFGFVFDNKPFTMAHELGHGAFRLEHPFKEYKKKGLKQDETQSVMDYAGGSDFLFTDWKQINDPKFRLYAFQRQSEGELGGAFAITPNNKKVFVSSTYLLKVKEVNVPIGTLWGFKLNGKSYEWSDEDNDYLDVKGNKIDLPEGVYKIYDSFNENDAIILFKQIDICNYQYIYVKYSEIKGKDIGEFFEKNFSNFSKQNIQFEGINKAGITNCEDDRKEVKSGCDDFYEYSSKLLKEDKDTIKLAFIKSYNERKHISTKDRSLGKFTHIQIVGDKDEIPTKELEIIEDKLHLLSYHRSDIFVSVVFLQKEISFFYTTQALNEAAIEIIKESNDIIGDKKALLFIVPYGKTLNLVDKCVKLGFGQTEDAGVVEYDGINVNNTENWDKSILKVYTDIEKPLFVNSYYLSATNNIVHRIDKITEFIKGYPFINVLNFYRSKRYDEMKALNEDYGKKGDYSNDLGTWLKYKAKADSIRLKYITLEQREGGFETASNWSSISTDDLGTFREIYMDEVPLTNELWIKSKGSWTWFKKVEIALNSKTISFDRKVHFYDFDRMVVLDDAVYGVLDAISLFPVFDTASDVVGTIYAGIRKDVTNTLVYSVSVSIPFAGSAYIRQGLKVGENASDLFGIVAKKANNDDGFVLLNKKINSIEEGEIHVSSIYFGGEKKITDKVLKEIEFNNQYINADFIRYQLYNKGDVKSLHGKELFNYITKGRGLSDKVIKRLKNKKIWTDEKLRNLNHYLSNDKKYGNLVDDLNNDKLFDAIEAIMHDPGNAWDIIKQTQSDDIIKSVTEQIGKSQFFKEVVGKGKAFETLVTSTIKTINPPFADLIADGYTPLSQIHLLRTGSSKKIIADDLFVKEVFDNRGRSYYRAVISDSKLSSGSPWTDNQKSELIDIFKKDKKKEFIEYEVRTKDFIEGNIIKQSDKIRIYREDVYKIVSEGDTYKSPIKMKDINFK